MPVCKYFLQGNCRYGERCYNEHPRGQRSSRMRQSRWDEDIHDQQWGRRGSSHGYAQSPLSRQERNYEQRNDFSRQERNYEQRNDFSRQERNYEQRNDYYDNRGRNRNYIQRGARDRYHWTPESRNPFAPLQNEAEQKPQAPDQDVIFKTVKDDIKTWAESKMWPYSCYSYSKGKRCVDGLPDVSPEELRTLAYLHKPNYATIVSEMELNYNHRKDELYSMHPDVKSHIMSLESNQIETNPSAGLKILMLYGPEYNFSAQDFSQSVIKQSGLEQPADNTNVSSQSHGFLPVFSGPLTPSQSQPKQAGLSLFDNTTASDVKPVKDGVVKNSKSTLYTDISELTGWEIECFKADRFTMGEIPTRPPAEILCR